MRSILLPLALLALAGTAVADDDFDDLDFGIDEEDLVFDGGDAREDPVEEDLFGFDDDPVEDFDVIDDYDDFDAYEDPDDDPLVGLTDELLPEQMAAAQPIEAGAKTATVQLDVVGKEPLADNYPAQIVAVERDAVVIELPVLLGRSRAGFEGGPYWLQVDVLSGDAVVATSTQWVDRVSLAEFGPSFAFFKVLVPVQATSGELTMKVQKLDQLGAAGAPLFTRAVGYSLK
jgi:hypothetical protein